MSDELKPCPFCGAKPPDDLIDTLYPTGIWWREIGGGIREYIDRHERTADCHPCYRMGCDVHNGGCGVAVHADTREEVITAWNRRSTADESAKPVEGHVSNVNDEMENLHRRSNALFPGQPVEPAIKEAKSVEPHPLAVDMYAERHMVSKDEAYRALSPLARRDASKAKGESE